MMMKVAKMATMTIMVISLSILITIAATFRIRKPVPNRFRFPLQCTVRDLHLPLFL